VKEIVIDFRRYKDLGFSVREAIAIARTRRRTRVALKRYDELAHAAAPQPREAK
jgi:hypothetical protein